jgi:hypothetical protein
MQTDWKIINTKRLPNNDLVTEVTYVINFKLENEQDRHIGFVKLEGDINDSNFIPYEDLTEAKVLDWVKSKIGEEKITELETSFSNRLQEKIDRVKNPEVLTGVPWKNKKIK